MGYVLSLSKPENYQSPNIFYCPCASADRCCCWWYCVFTRTFQERQREKERGEDYDVCFQEESYGNKHILYLHWDAQCTLGSLNRELPVYIWHTNNMNNNNKAVKSTFLPIYNRLVYIVHRTRTKTNTQSIEFVASFGHSI